MEPNKDFKELLALFNANHVEFVIVGAYALAFHGAPVAQMHTGYVIEARFYPPDGQNCASCGQNSK